MSDQRSSRGTASFTPPSENFTFSEGRKCGWNFPAFQNTSIPIPIPSYTRAQNPWSATDPQHHALHVKDRRNAVVPQK